MAQGNIKPRLEEYQNSRPSHVLQSFLECNEINSLGHIYELNYIRKKKKITCS